MHVLVDLDRTLAYFGKWEGPDIIGAPILGMIKIVKEYLDRDIEVRIFTARVSPDNSPEDIKIATEAIQEWTQKHLGKKLKVVAYKGYDTIRIFDDLAFHVKPNEGIVIGDWK